MALNDFITADHPLTRSTKDRKLAGVCGGIAERYDVDVSLVRLGFVIATLAGGIGLPLYVVAAVVVPASPPAGAPEAPVVTTEAPVAAAPPAPAA